LQFLQLWLVQTGCAISGIEMFNLRKNLATFTTFCFEFSYTYLFLFDQIFLHFEPMFYTKILLMTRHDGARRLGLFFGGRSWKKLV